jgi:hypothetical protein
MSKLRKAAPFSNWASVSVDKDLDSTCAARTGPRRGEFGAAGYSTIPGGFRLDPLLKVTGKDMSSAENICYIYDI